MLSKELEKIAEQIKSKDKEWLNMINRYTKNLLKVVNDLVKVDKELFKIQKVIETNSDGLVKMEKIPSPAATYIHRSIAKIIGTALAINKIDIDAIARTLESEIKKLKEEVKKQNN